MDVDIVALGTFVAIAAVILLTAWTEHRNAAEKQQRIDRVRRHI